ncbi:CTP synthase [Bifidobacterium reuteri]|uniref:CTP synthase n=2 Tax=Bifidobacterium reuteri TaxID=983706 RepID=A0A087CXG4_9BIFI|nr:MULTISPECIES: hypothetical protein [Bifidobacterium]KAA8825225.1 CTP synthase [Bifidobacterium reuteri]KFI87964.1 CTP synthase [Bifidobacterium reuteri DSM 23975]
MNKSSSDSVADQSEIQLCIAGVNAATRKRMVRRMHKGEVVSPYRGIYAESSYWSGLNPKQRILHVLEALSRCHPSWVYAGLSAAAAMDLDYPWSLLTDESIYVAYNSSRQGHMRSQTKPIFVSSDAALTTRFALGNRTVSVLTTTVGRALVDCALRYPFRVVLGMFDSAFRRKLVDAESVIEECDHLHSDCGPVFRLLHYTDARSENGGESLCRATMIERGFAVPQLQHEFIDPENAWHSRRVDFVWHTPDGRIIVLEYDGARKYVDPAMTKRRDIHQVVAAEKSRDDMLLRAGVTTVVHATYDDVVDSNAIWVKLMRAQVPLTGANWLYERE